MCRSSQKGRLAARSLRGRSADAVIRSRLDTGERMVDTVIGVRVPNRRSRVGLFCVGAVAAASIGAVPAQADSITVAADPAFGVAVHYDGVGDALPIPVQGPASTTQTVASADFNEDGRDDVASVECAYYNGCESAGIVIRLASARGVLGPPNVLPVYRTTAVGAADVNEDGHQDLVTVDADFDWVTHEFSQQRVHTFVGIGDGTFVSGSTTSLGRSPRPTELFLRDWNGDGHDDV